jgi:dGTPase
MNYFEEQQIIINSKPFKRLSDKTQVIVNLGQNAIIKTRLTHSIEVASIAREISDNIGSITTVV